MTLAFSLPPRIHSPLARLDARWKLAGFVIAGFAVAWLHQLPPAIAAFAGVILLAGLARLPVGWLLTRLSGAALFLLLFVVFLPFTVVGGTAWEIGPVSVSERGLVLAGVVLAKGLTLAVLAVLLVAAGPLEDTLKAAQSLRVPGLLVHVVLLTYRYLHLLREELRRLRIALRVRGYRNRASVHCYRTMGHLTGTLLVRGHERADRVGQAMRCRGFDGCFRSLTDVRTHAADVAFAVILAGAAVGLVVWDFLLR